MRSILKIAKLELSILFYSPVAWLVLAIFTIQSAMSFLDPLYSFNTTQQLGQKLPPLTQLLFGGTSGLFTAVKSYLYLYLPILTMGLMSRETSSGSISLLLSSPVKLREIILGKYLAIITYGLLLIVILAILGIVAVFSVPNLDVGSVFAGLLGLYLLICTYAAIGLFMSCLTTYQVVAAISTLTVFAMLRFVGTLGQNIDFVRDLTYFLSISGRTEKMIAGMVTTKDIFYYIIIICAFLTFCVLRLKADRELKTGPVKFARYAAVVAGALLLGYLSALPMLIGYFDLTAGKSLTISKTGQRLAKEIEGELKVTTYTNLLAPRLWNTLPKSRISDQNRLEQFKRFIPGMTTDYVYYYQKPLDSNFAEYRYNPKMKGVTDVDKIASGIIGGMELNPKLFLKPSEIDKKIDLKEEGYLTLRKLEYKGRSAILRFYIGPTEQDVYPREKEFMAAIKNLISDAPKAVLLSGNNERSSEGYTERSYHMATTSKIRRQAWINNGVDIDTLNLNTSDISAEVDILIIGDPTIAFSGDALKKITDFIDGGGNMLITGDPENRDILNPLLEKLGLKIRSGILVKPDAKFSTGFIHASVGQQGKTLDSNLYRIARYSAPVAIQRGGVLDYTKDAGFQVVPVLMSPKGGWNKASEIDPRQPALTFEPLSGDQKGEFPLSMALMRKVNEKSQRIYISADADFMSNLELMGIKRGENEYFLHGVMSWLTNHALPIDIVRPEPKDVKISATREQISIMKYVFNGVVPALIVIFGAIVLFRRRSN